MLAPAALWAQGPPSAAPGTLRLAVWDSDLGRDGPGLLLRDLRAGAPDLRAAAALIAAARPDALLLLDFDHDARQAALTAFRALLAEAGHPMPHAYAPAPNAGRPSGLDLDGDGRLGTADDALGYGRFQGSGGMALLARWPLGGAGTTDLSALPWRDLPGNRMPEGPGPEARAAQPLSSTGHWIVPLRPPEGPALSLLAWHAGPPVFGRVAGRNRARNHDETALWLRLLDGALPVPPPDGPIAVIGNANLDPRRGDGEGAAIAALLAHPRLQDPQPMGGEPPDTANADYPEPGPGRLRTSYILPDASLRVRAAGLVWPPPPARHALVWIDLAWPPG